MAGNGNTADFKLDTDPDSPEGTYITPQGYDGKMTWIWNDDHTSVTAVQLTEPDTHQIKTFDPHDGRLLTVQDTADDNTITYTYNPIFGDDHGGPLVQISDSYGDVVQFGYDSYGMLDSVTDEVTGAVTSVTIVSGMLTQITAPAPDSDSDNGSARPSQLRLRRQRSIESDDEHFGGRDRLLL